MRRWQSCHGAHCVIDHSSRPTFASPLKPLASCPQASSIRHSSSVPPYHRHIQTPQTSVHRRKFPLYIAPPRTPAHSCRPTTLPTTFITRAMSSDDAYMSFLNKANADLKSGRSQPQAEQYFSAARTETVDVNVKVPTPLASVDAYYVSETDEPFEPVALKWEGAEKGIWPDASHFSKLISTSSDLSSSIETLLPSSFDPKNHYASVLRAVRAAAVQDSGGDEAAVELKVYRVEVGVSRVEYYITALDVEGGLIVGLRAKAIES
ncbi:uncharacterized protein BJX67DRAFT_15634 [Aspergillus lucknowensis]|uniref:Uncharacterized protein n=1 Tax=Aspergillus lucknowensis TaxID=176173 RepID=A0ABR4M7X4_9EURO